jgi:hypothetical protein
MAKMITKLLSSACLIFLFFCVAVSYAQENQRGQTISLIYPDRSIGEWEPENAIEEAKYDIKNNKMKIYYSGTIAASPNGVLPEDIHLIKNLPIADGGIGCIITNSELRKKQAAYATKYNEIIVFYLKEAI